jgi:hypothetical protein
MPSSKLSSPFSSKWQEKYEECTEKQSNARKSLGISDLRSQDKLSPKNITALFALLKRKGYSFDASGSKNILSYNGLEEASKVLCRWPRPSELAVMAKQQNIKGVNFFKVTAKVDHPNNSNFDAQKMRSKFVGEMGSNFASVGRDYHLMYVWLHENELIIYGKDKDDCMQALEYLEKVGDDLQLTIKYKSSASKKLTEKSKDWIPDVKAVKFTPPSNGVWGNR